MAINAVKIFDDIDNFDKLFSYIRLPVTNLYLIKTFPLLSNDNVTYTYFTLF